MRGAVNTLNQQQREMFCAYINATVYVEGTANRFLQSNQMQLPSKIGLISNVYKAQSVKEGQQQWDVKIIPQFGSLGTDIFHSLTRRKGR